jgi:hypothetical protein
MLLHISHCWKHVQHFAVCCIFVGSCQTVVPVIFAHINVTRKSKLVFIYLSIGSHISVCRALRHTSTKFFDEGIVHFRTGYEESEREKVRLYSPTFCLTSSLDRGGCQRHFPTALSPGKDPIYIVQEGGWASGPVWTGAENLASTGIRPPDLPARIKSLYRLAIPAPWYRSIHYQYNETKVMHFSFSLMRIKGLFMFRALLGHPQELLHKLHLVYCVCVMSVGCGMVAVN